MVSGLIPENEFEEYVVSLIEFLNSSNHVTEFFSQLNSLIKQKNKVHFVSRIKSPSSALRTIRIKQFKSLSDANDYIGVSFLTETEEELKDLIFGLEHMFPDAERVNLLDENILYTDPHGMRKVPPLCYNLLTRKNFGEFKSVPIEIRVCTKEMFISLQPSYYEIYKNDTLAHIPTETKTYLKAVLHHIFHKISILLLRPLSKDQQNAITKEYKEIFLKNFEIISGHTQIVLDCVVELAQHISEYKTNKSFLLKQIPETALKTKVRKNCEKLLPINKNFFKDVLQILTDCTKNNGNL